MKAINLNALAGLQLAQQFQPQINGIMEALVQQQQHAADRRGAGGDDVTAVKDRVIAYANETAAAGVAATDANAALRDAMKLAGFPEGTALNYGRAVEGFRKIASGDQKKADGTPLKLAEATVKDAQRVMETPETSRKNELRRGIGRYVSAANEAQLKDILELVSGLGIKLKERGGRVTTTVPEAGEQPQDANAEQPQAVAA
jgi:hypothetical protein